MRDLEKRGPLEKAAGDVLDKTLVIQKLDVCCEESIKECINILPNQQVDFLGLCYIGMFKVNFTSQKKIFKREHCLVVVSNAGTGTTGPLECQSIATMK